MMALSWLSLLASIAHSFALLLPTNILPRTAAAPRMSSSSGGEEMDWRDMRAQLIAQESQADGTSASGGYAYESPLIEQGTILLGGTEQDFGFALRQQFFHKCVLLLLQHDDSFTKGIILNRPSAMVVDGWRMWCGHGQVAEGGMFVGPDNARGEIEMNALHSLKSPMADKLSTRVIKGVSVTSLDGAKALVEAGEAQQDDFWVCVGYSGWAPGQVADTSLQPAAAGCCRMLLPAAAAGRCCLPLLPPAASGRCSHAASALACAAPDGGGETRVLVHGRLQTAAPCSRNC